MGGGGGGGGGEKNYFHFRLLGRENILIYFHSRLLGRGNIFKFIFTPVYWGEKIYLSKFILSFTPGPS